MQVTSDFTGRSVEAERSGWFECSCCPTNMLRLLPSLSGYVYAQKGQDLYVNLFISSTANLLVDGQPLQVIQQNNYPWDGALSFTLQPAAPRPLTLRIRIPGWARGTAIPSTLYTFDPKAGEGAVDPNAATASAGSGKGAGAVPVEIRINGKAASYTVENGYAVLKGVWNKGDQITMNLAMPVERVVANAQLAEDAGKAAVQRGPLIYCAEWKDNGGKVSDLVLPERTPLRPQTRPDLLEGVTVLTGKGVTLIPYYSWANRGKGEMMVWFPAASH